MNSAATKVAPRPNTRVRIAVIGAIVAVIAVIPPLVTAWRSMSGMSQQGTGNTQINGRDINSNNQTNNTFVSMWVDGVRTLVGTNSKPVASMPAPMQRPAQALDSQPATKPQPVPSTPEPGAIGAIVSNASLLGDATWSPDPSRVNRFLTFYLRAEAIGTNDKFGSLDATLAREGKDVCTISLNSQTSPLANGVRWGSSTCHDTLPANASVTYRARVKATDMNPIVVRLERVDAVRE